LKTPISKLLFCCVAVLGTASCAMAAEAAPAQTEAQALQAHPLQGAADWRERMQKNHNADRSIEHQVRRLTKDLDLTPEQQEKVRQLSKARNDRIQKILDTAPPTLTHEAFATQVHAISHEYHDAVNAILTSHQLERMKAMVGRLDSGKEDRRAP
jgi:predicted transglutaminase-like cysteine proteinase